MESAPQAGRRPRGGRLRELAARVPLALVIVLVLAVELRIALTIAYDPAMMTSLDAVVYVGAAAGDLFEDPARTAGYPMFLRGVHAVSADVELTILLQHLLGIATGLLVYGAVRRLDAPRWVAVVAAAGALLSLDQISLEHRLLSEPLFGVLIAAAVYGAVRALPEPRRLRGPVTDRGVWLGLAAISLGLSVWVRPVSLPLVAALGLWVALALEGGWRLRLARGLAVTALGAAVVAGYAAIQSADNGEFAVSRSTGWSLYSRVAQFADCSRFEPPAGTRPLCDERPPSDRPGPDFWSWEPGSPAVERFGGPPNSDDKLGEFARRAILAQPWDYLKTAAIDTLKWFQPSLDARDYGGVGFVGLDLDQREPEVEPTIVEEVNSYYDDERVDIDTGAVGTLADLQSVFRLHPQVMVAIALLTAAALVLARGRLRRGVFLIAGCAWLLLVIPPATAIWNARFAVPVTGELLAVAAIGLWLVLGRLRDLADGR